MQRPAVRHVSEEPQGQVHWPAPLASTVGCTVDACVIAVSDQACHRGAAGPGPLADLLASADVCTAGDSVASASDQACLRGAAWLGPPANRTHGIRHRWKRPMGREHEMHSVAGRCASCKLFGIQNSNAAALCCAPIILRAVAWPVCNGCDSKGPLARELPAAWTSTPGLRHGPEGDALEIPFQAKSLVISRVRQRWLKGLASSR